MPETAAMEDYAFAWADDPSNPIYFPNSAFSYNRAGGPITITLSGTGYYSVHFDGMDMMWNVNGNVQVTAYGDSYIDDIHCNSSGWTDNTVEVRCYDDIGTFTDATYTVLLSKPKPIRDGVAHVRADQPITASYVPNADYTHNPGGGTTNITRMATGRYVVSFGGFGQTLTGGPGAGGNVQVTSLFSRYARCRVLGWSYVSGNASVECLSGSGTPIDASFSLLWQMPTERFDRDIAYAWSNTLATSSYEPFALYASNPANDGVFGSWSTTGRYVIEFQGLSEVAGPTSGHIQVTAYGSDQAECAIRNWGSEIVSVGCFDPAGNPTNGRFNVLRLQPTAVPEPGLLGGLAVGVLGVAAGSDRRQRTSRRRCGSDLQLERI